MNKINVALINSLLVLSSLHSKADCGDGANAVNQAFRTAVSTCDFHKLSGLVSDSANSNDPEKVIDRSEKNSGCARYSQMAVFHWKTGRPVSTGAADIAKIAEIDVNCGATLALLVQNGFQKDDPYMKSRSAVIEAVKGSSCLFPAVKLLIDSGSEEGTLALAEAKKTRASVFAKLKIPNLPKTDASVYEGYLTACDQTISYLENARAGRASSSRTTPQGNSDIGHPYGTSLAD